MQDKTQRTILGIDPGTSFMGYAVIQIQNAKAIELITIGTIELNKIKDHYKKLKLIFDRVSMLIDQFNINELSIEAPFYGKNVQSMLKLGRAQGTAIAAAIAKNVTIYEYAPRKIKMAVTGNGNASKQQVAAFIQRLLKIQNLDVMLDATDALAAAVCHFYRKDIDAGEDKYNSWKDFIKKNPGKIK